MDDYNVRSTLIVACQYSHIILPVLFILERNRWLWHWMQKIGYTVKVKGESFERWLNKPSENRVMYKSQAVEVFKAYIMEFDRIDIDE